MEKQRPASPYLLRNGRWVAHVGSSLEWVSLRSSRLLAASFILYGLVFAAFFAVNMPPFQNADEVAHMLRATQISRGQMIGVRNDAGHSGGLVDSGIIAAFWPFGPLLFHPEIKVIRSMYASAAHGWTGQDEWQDFPNTAVYPPMFYLPAAAGLWTGQRLGLSILQSLYLARLGNSLVAIVLGGMGIWVSGLAAPLLFAVLSLPMSLALMASVSQDGVMIGCTAIAAGLIAASWQHAGSGSIPLLVVTTVALALLCMARPPYAPLAVMPLVQPGLGRWPRVAAAAAILLACIAWSGFAAQQAMGVLRPDDPAIDPMGQLHWMLAHPRATADAVWLSIRVEASALLEQFIGRLGWLDTQLPPSYLAITAYLLPAAAALSFDRRRDGRRPHAGLQRLGAALTVCASLLGCVVLMFLIQYVTWNKVGRPVIEGVQGRYFLPLALMAATVLPALPGAPQWLMPVRGALIAGLILFPALSIGVVIRAVVLRFYLS